MHRSRPFVLVILAAAAACSKHDPSEGNDLLSQDRTLAAHLGADSDARRSPLPVTCSAITVAAAPSAANQQQAEELTRQAGVAEMHGNIQDARSLLRRASALDGTNKSAAYHLGRTSEALGDRATAMTSYCRYLTLAPTAAESVEARQRVTALMRSMPRTTAGVIDSVTARSNVAVAPVRQPAPQPTREHAPVRSRVVASATAPRSASARPSARIEESPRVTTRGEVRPATPSEPPTASTNVDDARGTTTAGGDVAVTPPQPPTTEPTTEPSPVPPRTARRGSIGVQSAIIGAAAGAIFGAAGGRSVKSTVIGAAAGGVLGTVIGTTARPGGRGIRS